jgi:hypothetical protein
MTGAIKSHVNRKVVSLGLALGLTVLLSTASSGYGQAATQPGSGRKTFIDYFLPTPSQGELKKDVWGAAEVGPRETKNGLEDVTSKQWSYWDGQILKSADGKFHMYASRWDQASGHMAWGNSLAVHAVSDTLSGPYVDKGLLWPEDRGGRGHNVTALKLPDGRYAVVTSETRPGDVFVSRSPDGPWENIGQIKVERGEGYTERDARISNVSIMVRPDGDFMIVPRAGVIWISKTGILGPYKIVAPTIFTTVPGVQSSRIEDPVVWYSGGLYHVIGNNFGARTAYHFTSRDGITGWKNRGLAYDPRRDFVRYTDGTVNHWALAERPGVYIEDGHVRAVTLAVLNVAKRQEVGNDANNSKIIVIPFDGEAFDRDMAKIVADEEAAEAATRPKR